MRLDAQYVLRSEVCFQTITKLRVEVSLDVNKQFTYIQEFYASIVKGKKPNLEHYLYLLVSHRGADAAFKAILSHYSKNNFVGLLVKPNEIFSIEFHDKNGDVFTKEPASALKNDCLFRISIGNEENPDLLTLQHQIPNLNPSYASKIHVYNS